MDNKTATYLNKLNSSLDNWAKELAEYSHDQLNAKPSDGGWSVMQNVHHLMLSESGAMAYIKKKLSFSPDLPNKGIIDAWRGLMINGYLASPVKFKAPKGIGTAFLPDESDWPATLHKWRKQREQMHLDLEAIDPEYYRKQVFKHPLAGRVSISTTLSFLHGHFHRHRKQAKRVISAME